MQDNVANKEKVLEFLRSQNTAVVATISKSDEPQVATVCFVMDGDFNLYFLTKKTSRKFENIHNNSHIGVVVGFDLDNISTVQMQGKAEVLTEDRFGMVMQIAEKTMGATQSWWPLLKMAGFDYKVIKVHIEWLRWLRPEGSAPLAKYEDNFYQILP